MVPFSSQARCWLLEKDTFNKYFVYTNVMEFIIVHIRNIVFFILICGLITNNFKLDLFVMTKSATLNWQLSEKKYHL